MANSIQAWKYFERNIITHLIVGKTLQNKKTVKKKNPTRYHPEKKQACTKNLGDRFKQDQSQYAEHRKYETLRVKAYRTTLTEEQNKKYNEKTRLRMKKYRA
ncbi:MAG: hypothetical protein H0A75_08470 [Candidatus Methanofishera endochildressiae]|uniref:Uncharacterized protein n=1 Tax=Candidatus Methanofishera endochildressiae TaxID=2738884 RepID=A0A7Z0MPR9_9GAMM|nr:hypothetical protein [Candidatus Methanofishera endochildressiae]